MRELNQRGIEDRQVDELIKTYSWTPARFEDFVGLMTYLGEKEGSLWTNSESTHASVVLWGLYRPTTTKRFSGPEGPGLQHFAERQHEKVEALFKAAEGQRWTKAKSEEVHVYITTARTILKLYLDDERRDEEFWRSLRVAALSCLVLFAIPSACLSYIHRSSWIGALLAGWLAFCTSFHLSTDGVNLGFWIEHINRDIAKLVDGLERQSELLEQERSKASD